MRLRRLDLTRFGHFTDFSMDFGSKEQGKPDLHIIFGPNEAGKTTAFDGYLDLLFGIPTRSKYNFLHDYENMRVGGALEIDGNPIELVRIKRNKGDLITPSGETANPVTLLHALDGIDRDQYRAMFSLDDETIEAGGEDILASQGNLGELLFSAAAGLSDLGSVLETARAEVDQFHKPRARKTALAEAKRELQELHDQIRELDVPASAFRHLKEERDIAARLLDESKKVRDGLLLRRARLEAMIECLPLLKTLGETRKALTDYAAYPSAQDGAAEEAQLLKVREVEAATKQRQSKALLEAEQKAREELKLDTEIAEITDEFTVLLDAPKSRAQTADEDLPKRETELEGLVADLSGFAKELGLAGPEDGILPEARLAQLEDLAADYADAKKQHGIALNEEREAKEKLEGLKAETRNKEEPASTEQELERLLENLAPEECASRHDKAEDDVKAATASLTKALEGLKPWSGTPPDLANLSLSEAEARRIAEHWTKLRDQHEGASRDLRAAQLDYDRLAARLGEFEKGDAATVVEEAKDARVERDVLWEEHSKDLRAESAAKFHDAMVLDDALQEARLGFSERLARLRELQLDTASAKGTLDTQKRVLVEVEDLLTTETASLNGLLSEVGLPESYDPRDIPAWQALLSTAKERSEELAAKKKLCAEAKQAVENAIGRLNDALALSDDKLDLKELTKKARAEAGQVAIAKTKAEANQTKLSEAEAEATRRSDEVKRLSNEISGLEVSWEGEVTVLPKPLQKLDDFRWKLPTLRKLAAKLAEHDQLQRRIRAMMKDRDTFAQEIEGLAARVGEPSEASHFVLAERLRRRLERANKSEDEFQTLTQKIETLQADMRLAEADLVAIKSRVEEMAAAYKGVHDIRSVDDLKGALVLSAEADQLRLRETELRERILSRLGALNLAAAEELLAGQDVLELKGEQGAVTQDLETAEAEHTEKIGDLRAAKDALEKVGGDNAPAKLEERRQTLLLGLEEQARTVLRLRLGILAAEQALAAFRDEHRSNMLSDTEAAFRKLTNGGYQDLRTQVDGQKEILLALRKRDGRSITVSEMSKGTRFQLYLALRLAGYRQYASGGTTLPFVADDIMETFDNTRTTAAVGLLREIAVQGQALYFTHHEHVVELAREVCGEQLEVHQLPPIN